MDLQGSTTYGANFGYFRHVGSARTNTPAITHRPAASTPPANPSTPQSNPPPAAVQTTPEAPIPVSLVLNEKRLKNET